MIGVDERLKSVKTVRGEEREELSDALLLDRWRHGHEASFDALYRRHHDIGVMWAGRVVGAVDAEDVTSDAFERIYRAMRDGGGPRQNFPAYLRVTIRNIGVDRLRKEQRSVPVEEEILLPFLVEEDGTGAHARNEVLHAAFTSLPKRWQIALWMIEVEQLPHTEIGDFLHISPNAVAALGVRARRGLAEAFLEQHLNRAPSAECRRIAPLLPDHVLGARKKQRRIDVEQHLAGCPACRSTVADLRTARTDFAALIAPLVGAGAWLSPAGGSSAVLPTVAPLVAPEVAGHATAHLLAGGVTGKVLAVAASVTVGVVGVTVWVQPKQDIESAPVVPQATVRAVEPTVVPAPRVTVPAEPSPSAARTTPPRTPTPRPTPTERTPSRAPTPSVAPSTSPAPSRAPAPARPTSATPRPVAPVGPDPSMRVGTTSSPKGPDWVRVVFTTDEAVPGVKVSVSATGGEEYCDSAGCATTSSTRTWMRTMSTSPGTSVSYLDLRAPGSARVQAHLTGSGWSNADTSNDSGSVTVG